MVFSNVLQKSSESSPEANSIQCALAAVEIMEKKFGEDSTFLVDFYAKFQLRKIFNLWPYPSVSLADLAGKL